MVAHLITAHVEQVVAAWDAEDAKRARRGRWTPTQGWAEAVIVQASRRSAERERVRVAGWQALETVKRLKDAVRGPHADAVLQQAQLVLFAGLG